MHYDSPYPFNSVDRLSPDFGNDGKMNIVQRRSRGSDLVDCAVSTCAKKDFEGSLLDAVVASDAEVVFISPSMLWQQRSPILPKDGLVADVYSSLKFCIKGMEYGSAKGTMPDTK
jgi:hypothetical protein